jgi:uncharacterized protein
MDSVKAPATSDRSGLEAIASAVPGRGVAPVERWNPPYCGDIGLEIRADGSWLYQGTPIGRRALVELFASVLRKDEDGQTYLVTPAEKVLVRVADAPFLAVEMAIDDPGPAQTVKFRTNLDEWVPVGPANPLRFVLQPETGGLKPYVVVRGRLEALVARAVYLDLVAIAEAAGGETADDGPPGVWSGGVWWPIEAGAAAT